MTSLCNTIILLFEYILQRFMADIHIVGRVHSSRLSMRSYRLEEKVKTLINHHFDI